MKLFFKILIPIVFVLSACSPQHRLQHLLSSHPELKAPETILIHDTVIIPETKYDTAVSLVKLRDTLFLNKKNFSVQLLTRHDTLFVQGKCKADTIIKIFRVPVEKIRLVKPDRTTAFLGKLPWIVVGLIVIVAALFYFFRR